GGRAVSSGGRAGGLLSALKREKKTNAAVPDGCDPAIFAEQCKEYLERAAIDRDQMAERGLADAAPFDFSASPAAAETYAGETFENAETFQNAEALEEPVSSVHDGEAAPKTVETTGAETRRPASRLGEREDFSGAAAEQRSPFQTLGLRDSPPVVAEPEPPAVSVAPEPTTDPAPVAPVENATKRAPKRRLVSLDSDEGPASLFAPLAMLEAEEGTVVTASADAARESHESFFESSENEDESADAEMVDLDLSSLVDGSSPRQVEEEPV